MFHLDIIRLNYYSIKALRSFDRETAASYRVELYARDFGQPSLRRSMTFDLNITDINDEKPLFKSNYTFNIIENNPIPTVIGQITAHDADQGLNGQIKYSIASTGLNFFISPDDGTLSANISFDYELKREYNIKIRAIDYGNPPLDSIVHVKINVLNQNEYSPEFEKNMYYFSINENLTNSSMTLIGKVKAKDRDYGDHVSYSLDDNQSLFKIDQNGNIWSDAIFDREAQDEYKLTVFAIDNSTTGSVGSSTVIVQIR